MIKTKRWNAPVEADDGLRFLITRYRPREVGSSDAPWHDWWRSLAPSEGLLADWRAKKTSWAEYRERFLAEMKCESARRSIAALARMHSQGRTVTLLCFCIDESRCHRSLVRQLVEEQAGACAPSLGVRQLPTAKIDGKMYYRDDRLREFRAVGNPHDSIPFEEVEQEWNVVMLRRKT